MVVVASEAAQRAHAHTRAARDHSSRRMAVVSLVLPLRLLVALLLFVALLHRPLCVAAQTRLSGLTTTAASMVPPFAAATAAYDIQAVFATSTVSRPAQGDQPIASAWGSASGSDRSAQLLRMRALRNVGSQCK